MMEVVLALIGALLLGIMVFSLVLHRLSPGKAKPFLDEQGREVPGSISEVVRLNIGGVDQGMLLRGKSTDHPVILFLHGGPGSPEYMMSENHPLPLDEIATVCWWDQRGAGMSYSKDIPIESMTLAQMIEDTAQVARYLCKRFKKEKVYLMGHSWGTFLGTYTAQKYPELFHAYIGIGQVVDQFKSEQLAYDYMLAHARELGDKKMEKKLLKHTLRTPADLNPAYMQSARTTGMNKYGIGITRKMKSMLHEAILPLLKTPIYTAKQKANYVKGMMFSQKHLWDDVVNTNLIDKKIKLEVPVYIVHGLYDYQVSHALSKQYFDSLDAPQKHFYTFEQSAHSPLFEEPDRFIRIMQKEILLW